MAAWRMQLGPQVIDDWIWGIDNMEVKQRVASSTVTPVALHQAT